MIATVIKAQSALTVRAFVQCYYDTLSQMVPVVDPVNQPTLFDTITVELHEYNTGNLAYSEKAVFDINGNGSITVPAINFGNNYYIVLKHRNSLETWSAVSILISNNASYDFSTDVTQAYAGNMIWVDSVACIYSGDFNQDGFIDGGDYSIMDIDIQAGTTGNYLLTDLNHDGQVDAFDFIILDANINAGIHVINPIFTSIQHTQNSEDNEIHIYPNPAHHSINLFSAIKNLKGVLDIYTVSGSLVRTINDFQEGQEYNISNLVSGGYIVELTNSVHIFTQQLMVEN